MSRSNLRAAGMLLAALGLAVGLAAAQSPAVNPTEATDARAQQQQQAAQPLNNQPVWKEIRSGAPQVTTVQGRETNVLIQPEGQTWRAARVPIATAGGFLFVFALLVLLAFYLWRGPIALHGQPTGRLIERFTVVQRVVHWTVAITFTALGVTGLIITFGKSVLLPLIGYTLFSWLAILAKNLHNFVGPILVVMLPVLIVTVRPLERLQRTRLAVGEEVGRHAVRRARPCRQGQRGAEVPVLGDGGAARSHALRHRD